MKFRANHQQSHHGMNLVPLIDVLLILLIFFIVTNAMARFETELEISVPAAEASKTSERNKSELVINVRQDGTLVWNSDVLNETALSSKLNSLAQYSKQQAVVIRGDVNTPYEKIVRVLDLTHRAGLYHVSFATTKSAGPG